MLCQDTVHPEEARVTLAGLPRRCKLARGGSLLLGSRSSGRVSLCTGRQDSPSTQRPESKNALIFATLAFPHIRSARSPTCQSMVLLGFSQAPRGEWDQMQADVIEVFFWENTVSGQSSSLDNLTLLLLKQSDLFQLFFSPSFLDLNSKDFDIFPK